MATNYKVDGTLWIEPKLKVVRFYSAIAVFMTMIVVVGFWPSYFGPLLRGNVERPFVIQLHGVVFVGWMTLLLAQVALVAMGRTKTHRQVGNIGVIYGFLVLAMGLTAGIASPVMHLAKGEWEIERAAGFLLITLGDMTLYGTFFIAAMAYRRKPEIHKRMIVLATIALLFAAVARMSYLESRPLLFLTVWLSPLVVAMGHDLYVSRRIHRAYLLGLGILLIGYSRTFFLDTAAWQYVGRSILGFFD
jgi:hypothetical protein